MKILAIILVMILLYVAIITFVYALLGVARQADEYVEYQYKRDFGSYESR